MLAFLLPAKPERHYCQAGLSLPGAHLHGVGGFSWGEVRPRLGDHLRGWSDWQYWIEGIAAHRRDKSPFFGKIVEVHKYMTCTASATARAKVDVFHTTTLCSLAVFLVRAGVFLVVDGGGELPGLCIPVSTL